MMRSASVSSPWNFSVRRQSKASVAVERTTDFLPWLVPKSVSRPQIATTTPPGTPNCCSVRLRIERMLRQHLVAPLVEAALRNHAAGEFLEALLEHVLALVGGEHLVVDGEPVERREALLRNALRAASFLNSVMKAGKPPGGLHCAAYAGVEIGEESAARNRAADNDVDVCHVAPVRPARMPI